MGIAQVDATVRNPAHRAKAWTGSFLVDTGAVDSLVPRPHLEAIGLRPTGQRVYVTADGREVALDVTVGELEIMGELSDGVIVFGDDGAETAARRHGAGIRRHRGRSQEPTPRAPARRPAAGLPPAGAPWRVFP